MTMKRTFSDAKIGSKGVLRGSAFAFLGAVSMLSATPAAAQLATPYITEIMQIAPCNGDYRVKWSAIPGATFYQIYNKPAGTPNYYLLGSPTVASYRPHATSPYVDYIFRACDGNSCGAFSEPLNLSYYNGCE